MPRSSRIFSPAGLRRAVGAFDDDLARRARAPPLSPIWFSSAHGAKMSAFVLEELLARDRLAAGVAGDRAVLLDVVLELVRVEALGVVAGSPE